MVESFLAQVKIFFVFSVSIVNSHALEIAVIVMMSVAFTLVCHPFAPVGNGTNPVFVSILCHGVSEVGW